MAIWRRRSKAGPSASSDAGTGLNGVNELRGELESLKAELSSAQAESAERERQPSARRRRGLVIATGAVTVGAGVAVGVLVSGGGANHPHAAPIEPAPGTSASGTATSSAVGPAASSVTPPAGPPNGAESLPTSVPAPSSESPTGGLVVVAPGQSFWSIALSTETRVLGREPTNREVSRYWLALISANTSRLVRADDPDLLYVGQEVLLPPV